MLNPCKMNIIPVLYIEKGRLRKIKWGLDPESGE